MSSPPQSFSAKFTNSQDAIIDYSKLRAVPATEFSSEIPFHIPQLITAIRTPLRGVLRVLDMTAHVGGFSLPWAKTYPKDRITAIELDPEVYKCLEWNVKRLKLKNIKTVNADSVVFLESLSKSSYDFVYLDPPWGGPDYRFKKGLQLFLGRVAVPEIVARIFDNEIADWVFFKAPLNYDFQSLPFAYTIRTIKNLNANKRFPDYFLVSLCRRERKPERRVIFKD